MDPSIQSFLKSMVNILLLIMLILAVIGKLGIELTGFAALLASAGVAIGMAKAEKEVAALSAMISFSLCTHPSMQYWWYPGKFWQMEALQTMS